MRLLRNRLAAACAAIAMATIATACQDSGSSHVVLGSAAPACRAKPNATPAAPSSGKPNQLVPAATKPTGLRLADGAVSYQTDIKPMVDTYCAQCHVNDKSPDLSTYASVAQSANNCLNDMQQGTMPKGSQIPSDQVDKFQAWITAGTPETSGGGTPPAGPPNPGPVSPPVGPGPVSPPIGPGPISPPSPGNFPPALPTTPGGPSDPVSPNNGGNPVFPGNIPPTSPGSPPTGSPTQPATGPDCM